MYNTTDMDLWNSLTCPTPKTENTASQYVHRRTIDS